MFVLISYTLIILKYTNRSYRCCFIIKHVYILKINKGLVIKCLALATVQVFKVLKM